MLVLSRKPGEKVIIDGGITVSVVEASGNRVRLGIEAPDQVRILRAELACWQEGAAADNQAQPNGEARPKRSQGADADGKSVKAGRNSPHWGPGLSCLAK